LLDDPSVRVVQRILEDNARLRRESEQLRAELKDVRLADLDGSKEWAKEEAAFIQIVSHGTGSSLARGANA
jgi:regulator of replication initiation timing